MSATKQPSTSVPVARRSVRQHPPVMDDKKLSDKVISVNTVNAKTSASGSCSDILKSNGASKSGNSCAVTTPTARSKAAVAVTTTNQTNSPPPADEINTRRKTRSGAVGGEFLFLFMKRYILIYKFFYEVFLFYVLFDGDQNIPWKRIISSFFLLVNINY